MKDFFPKFVLKQLSMFIAIIVIFIHNVVLDKNFECSCEGQPRDCTLYMALPFFIILFLILWMDKTFQRVWSYSSACLCSCECPCVCRQFVSLLVYHVLKAAFIGALWVISVLIDGDWYVCCWNDRSELQKNLACRDPTALTAEEKMAKAKLKSFSKDIGMWILCVSLFVAATYSPLSRLKCWKNSVCGSREVRYHRAILDEEENVVKEILTTAAKLKLTETIKRKLAQPQWQQCFDVAKELIDENVAPTLPANQEVQSDQQLVQPSDQQSGQELVPRQLQQLEQKPRQQLDQQEPWLHNEHEVIHLLAVPQDSPDATNEAQISAAEASEQEVLHDVPI